MIPSLGLQKKNYKYRDLWICRPTALNLHLNPWRPRISGSTDSVGVVRGVWNILHEMTSTLLRITQTGGMAYKCDLVIAVTTSDIGVSWNDEAKYWAPSYNSYSAC